MSTQVTKYKNDAVSIRSIFVDLLRGQMDRERFDGFVEDMRAQPEQLDVLDMELNDVFVEVRLDRNLDNYDPEQENDEIFSDSGLINSKTPDYQALAVDIFRWLDANTRNFESSFISAMWDYSYSTVHLKFKKEMKIDSLLGNSTMKYPNTESSQLCRMFLKSRPEGYFSDINIDHKEMARLGEIIGERLLNENKHNLVVLGKIFGNDLSL